MNNDELTIFSKNVCALKREYRGGVKEFDGGWAIFPFTPSRDSVGNATYRASYVFTAYMTGGHTFNLDESHYKRLMKLCDSEGLVACNYD